ncbi:hypothetical protein DI487_08490 [Flavobacterium sediminis]|uniref:Uncharacterized protein n=1 Tax=Flavobacterium sediminis TaxID=2201181 RepID=A0A2U8QVI0_9FLAO|nr:hypothetical protein [Flavobacterium sediminis]AWM13896.1 hypothetical protein DI487_08490 [Flavobacterium sediminis]
MAEILKANCRICNYKVEVKYGGGKFDYLTNNPVPAFNKTTEEIESVNFLTEKENSNYVFYSNDEIKGDNEDGYIFRNFDLELNQINNYCPKCKNYSLTFQSYIYS